MADARYGDKFDVGSWNNGAKYKWMNPIAVAEIVIVSFFLMLPFVPAANPFNDAFDWTPQRSPRQWNESPSANSSSPEP